MKKKIITTLILLCFMLQSYSLAWASTPQSVSTQNITSGATQTVYNWATDKGNVKISVVTVDLNDPYAYLTIVPGGGRFCERSTVSQMTAMTNPVALTNGDFFNMSAEGAPIGATVIDSELVSSPSYLTGTYALGITNDRKAYIEQFSFSGYVANKSSGVSFPLSGVNKTYYWQENDNSHSHLNKLHLYTDMWGGTTRGQDSYSTDVAEALIQDNKVIGVKSDGAYPTSVSEGVQILHGDGEAADFIRNLLIGDELEINYQMTPDKDWQMVIGGHALLVDNGQTVPYTKDLSSLGGVRARTAVGISADGSKVYIAAVEGRTYESAGLSLDNLASFMQYIGAYKAVNLDGGGSTAMTVRDLGSTTATRVINPEGNGSERKVVEGLALFSTAPQGALAGIKVVGSQKLFIGESALFTAQGWDEYYNPYSLSDTALTYGDSAGLGTWQGNTFTAAKAGETNITITANGIQGVHYLQVIGVEAVDHLELSSDSDSIISGGMVQISAKAVLKDGTTKTLSPALLTFQAEGGTIDEKGILTVTASSGNVLVKAGFEGLSAEKTIKVTAATQQYLLDNLNGISSHTSPDEVTGSVELAADPAGGSQQVLKLNYNFSNTKETAASYIVFEQDAVKLSSNTKKMMVDIYGSGNNEWVRVELRDKDENVYRYTLAQNVDWQGWKSVELDLSNETIAQDAYLWRIYTVENANEARPAVEDRSLYFRNLRLSASSGDLVNIRLQIGSNVLIANELSSTMDTAPYVTANGRTMVPVRFITEALGGEAVWDGENQRVSLILDNNLIQMYIGESTMEVNGISKSLDTPATIQNSRTMIPLRAVSEAFGLVVNYDGTDQSITIFN